MENPETPETQTPEVVEPPKNGKKVVEPPTPEPAVAPEVDPDTVISPETPETQTPEEDGEGFLNKKDYPIRRLISEVKKYGAQVFNWHNREHLAQALESVGHTPEVSLEAEDLSKYWSIVNREIGDGAVYAEDPLGWYSAHVSPDGSAEIRLHTPSLLNRQPGMQYASDQIFTISSLEDFAVRLGLLVNEADEIFEENSAKLDKAQKAKQALIEAGELPESTDGRDPRIAPLEKLCEQYGLTGPHLPNESEMPFKLAEAMNIDSTVKTDGETGPKPWDVLADEVLAWKPKAA